MIESIVYGIIGIFVLYKLATYKEPKNETPEQRRKRNQDVIW
jgi:hypothetical protein